MAATGSGKTDLRNIHWSAESGTSIHSQRINDGTCTFDIAFGEFSKMTFIKFVISTTFYLAENLLLQGSTESNQRAYAETQAARCTI